MLAISCRLSKGSLSSGGAVALRRDTLGGDCGCVDASPVDGLRLRVRRATGCEWRRMSLAAANHKCRPIQWAQI